MNSDGLVRIEENSYRKKPDKQVKKKTFQTEEEMAQRDRDSKGKDEFKVW